jgi:hypothetical protein
MLFAVRVLKGLWRNDLTALKGDCPNCGEEVISLLVVLLQQQTKLLLFSVLVTFEFDELV